MNNKIFDEDPLILHELLLKSDKILFITHLAIGDFTYMQNYFSAFRQKYPHIKIDLCVDEGRGKSFLRRWKKTKLGILDHWLTSTDYFNKIYKNTGSRKQLKRFIQDAKKENYPIVVSLGTINSHRYARYARAISKNGYVVGVYYKFKWFNFIIKISSKKFDKFLFWNDLHDKSDTHISNTYANCFNKIFGLNIEKKDRLPFLNFPKKWSYYGKLKFLYWGIYKKENEMQKTIFVNTFAKTKKRCWSIDKVVKLFETLKKTEDFYNSNFIINVMPSEYEYYKKLFNFDSQRIFIFSADVNFFQLPAVISCCDLVVSVETSIIHLAAALKIPVIALMRQKNPEWIPLGSKTEIVCTKSRKDWIKNISVDDVTKKTISFLN